jgi:hypothetical protein
MESARSFPRILRRSGSIPSVERDEGGRFRVGVAEAPACIGDVALALPLASYATPEDLRREGKAGYGFHPGTDAFASCLQKESLARRAPTSYLPPYWEVLGYWWRGSGGRTGLSGGSDPAAPLT